MLKWLSELKGAAEARRGDEDGPGGDAQESPDDPIGGRAIGPSIAHDRDAVDGYAFDEGAATMQAYTLNAAYAECIAEGKSNAYSIVYAAAYGIGRSIIGASEQWARSYAQACAHAIAAGAPVGFVSAYGHAVADGASPEDAFVFARRFAA